MGYLQVKVMKMNSRTFIQKLSFLQDSGCKMLNQTRIKLALSGVCVGAYFCTGTQTSNLTLARQLLCHCDKIKSRQELNRDSV